MNVPARLRLPVDVDVAALRAEALALAPATWVAHFNQQIYEGEWSGVSLRSVGGVADRLYPDPAADAPYADTALLATCPAHRSFLARLRCPLLAARLLALGPGAAVQDHTDYRLGWADGEIRLHVPIVSGPEVEFILADDPVVMRPGEVWYLDLTLPHRLANRSSATRIHLVVDCVVNDWLEELATKASETRGGPLG